MENESSLLLSKGMRVVFSQKFSMPEVLTIIFIPSREFHEWSARENRLKLAILDGGYQLGQEWTFYIYRHHG